MKRIKDYKLCSIMSIRVDMSNSINNEILHNEWTMTNTTTLIDWIIYSNLYILLIETYASHVRHVLKINTLWSLLISSITSTISITQFTITDTSNPMLSFFIKGAIVITSVLTSMITGYIKIEKMQEKMEFLNKTRDQWMKFMFDLTSELQQGENLRQNAVNVIRDKRNEFNKLCTKRINIPSHIKIKVSKYLTKNKHYDLDIKYINVISKCCITCYNRQHHKKLLIDETHRRLDIYYIVNDIIKKQLLRMGEIFKNDIKTIKFNERSHLIHYEIVKNDVYMMNENTDSDDVIKRYSPMSVSSENIIIDEFPPLPPSSKSSASSIDHNIKDLLPPTITDIKILSERHDNINLQIDP